MQPSAKSSPYVGRITTTGVARTTSELPEGEQEQRADQDADARLDEPGAGHGVRAAGQQRQRQAGQDDEQGRRSTVRELREAARRDRAVVVGTDVRGHHPEHREATGDVDPHDAAHARDASRAAR